MVFFERRDSDGGLIWPLLLILLIAAIVFIVFFEMWQIAKLGFCFGRDSKITNFSNLNGVLFALVLLIVFSALVIASGFCCEMYFSPMYRNNLLLDGDLWFLVLLAKGFLSVHLLLALPIFLFVKITHFVSWIFKRDTNSESANLNQYANNQSLQLVSDAKVTQ